MQEKLEKSFFMKVTLPKNLPYISITYVKNVKKDKKEVTFS